MRVLVTAVAIVKKNSANVESDIGDVRAGEVVERRGGMVEDGARGGDVNIGNINEPEDNSNTFDEINAETGTAIGENAEVGNNNIGTNDSDLE